MKTFLLFVTFFYVSLNLTVQAHAVAPNYTSVRCNDHTTKYDSLPSPETLFASLRSYHAAQTDSRTAEFKIQEKLDWMKYLPSVGLGYTLGTRNGELNQRLRPNLNFSFSQIFNSKRDKELRHAKIESIERQNDVDFKTDSLNLLIALKRVEIVRTAATELQAAKAIDDELFKLSQDKYDKKEVSAFQYLNEKRQYFERKERIVVKTEQLLLLEIEALRAAKW